MMYHWSSRLLCTAQFAKQVHVDHARRCPTSACGDYRWRKHHLSVRKMIDTQPPSLQNARRPASRRRSAAADQWSENFGLTPIHSSKGARGASGAKWAVTNLARRSSNKQTSNGFSISATPSGDTNSMKAISMKRKWYGDSAFRVEAGAAKLLIDRFLSGNFSRDKWWIGRRRGEDPTQGGGR